MMIKEQVKALWKICFDDSEEFVEMYFRLRYKTEVNVAIQSGDEVISALQMLPYPMTFGGETVQTSYISGACTHPDFRSKGVMRELLSQSFARMLRNGDKHIIINELCAENKDVEYSLLYAIRQHTGYKCMVQILPPEEKQPQHPLGMARIINAKEVLQIYAAAFPEDEMQLELSDKQLSVNNGYYYLCKGKCMYSTERLPGTHIQMNISELTNRILQPLKPYMSLMLN